MKLLRKDGKLTRYGFACGYAEHKHGVIISCLSVCLFVLRVTWYDENGKYWSETTTSVNKARKIAARHYAR